jgi:DNA-binding GntR family transcriptional regulator
VRTRSSFDEHRKLLDLFARGEHAAFEAAMTTHITNSGVVYAKALKVD